MIYIGIDPGKKGGYAIIDSYNPNPDLRLIVKPWDDAEFRYDMYSICLDNEPLKQDHIVCAVEKVGAMPHQGVVSMFNFGASYGFIQGVLTAYGIPYQLVPPGVWKREFSIVQKGKTGSVDVCKRLFPDVSLFPTERCRKESDGMSDALCLAEYARRKF